MRIGLDASIIPMGGGVANYISHLLMESENSRPDIQFKLFLNSTQKRSLPDRFGHFNITKTRIPNRMLDFMWNRVQFPPIEAIIGNVDVFHSPAHSPVYALCPPAKKWVVTVHDLFTFKMNYKSSTQARELSVLKRIERYAARIIAVSNSTRNDLLEIIPSVGSRTVVIPEGVDERFFHAQFEAETLTKYGIAAPYILYVGSADGQKNLHRLIKAFSKISHKIPHSLVLAGKLNERYRPIIDMVKKSGLSSRVIFTDRIEDADLPSLYRGADLFVLPSLYEGFGLVLLEAMAAGTPIATSDISSMPEVAGDSGILFNPYSESEMHESIYSILTNPALRSDLKRRGIERARAFTWKRMAEETLRIYEEVISE